MDNVNVKEIEFGSPEQIESVNLRYKILREPLGLQFDENDLAKEHEDFHIAAFVNSKLVGILLLKPTDTPGIIKMRQVAVDEKYQSQGIGKAMVTFTEKFAFERGFLKLELHARKTAVPFYLSLGYFIKGDLFYEVGIPHKKMVKSL
ncbi:MAG: GNAT family N-acetyltransferase [Bacteroidia bacterium]